MSIATVSNGKYEVKIAGYTNVCRKCGESIVKGRDRVVQVPHIDPNVTTKWWVHEGCKDKPYPSMENYLRFESGRYRRKFKSKAKVGSTMPSRFESVCKCCSEMVHQGDVIQLTREHGWIHLACAQRLGQAQADPTAEPTAEPKNHVVPPPIDPEPQSRGGGERFTSDLFDRVVSELRSTAELLKDVRGAHGDLADSVETLAAKVDQLEKRQPKQIVLKGKDHDQVRDLAEHTHPIFEKVLELAAARKNIFVPGPSGCGKSHLAGQVARAMGLDFAFISCSVGMSEGHLTGRLLPVGDAGKFEHVRSDFVRLFEEGGVFLIDEMDAADANVLLVINAALANGHMAVPNRPENPLAKRHPDFICIAAANTWGSGADRQYVGRNQLDGATLDRFRIGQIAMDYDTELESQLCPNKELFDRLIGYRELARSNRLERVISTRFLIDAYDMVTNQGWSMERVDDALFADWRTDEVAKVKR